MNLRLKRQSFQGESFGSKIKEVIGKLSKGLMVPIAVLPLAGLFLGIGATIANQTSGKESLLFLNSLGNYMKLGGDAIFGALPALFAVAIAIAFTGDAALSGFAAVVGWLVFNSLQSALISPIVGEDGKTITDYYSIFGIKSGIYSKISKSVFTSNFGIFSLSSSVFGGIIIGSLTAIIYKRFYQIQLPAVLGFFNGTRFVPIAFMLFLFVFTPLFMLIWPLFGIGLSHIGNGLGKLSRSGGANALIFGYIERALVPFGLHHAFYSPLWYSTAGGSIDTNVPVVFLGDVAGNGKEDVYKILGEKLGTKDSLVNSSSALVSLKDALRITSKEAKGPGFTADGDQGVFQYLNGNVIGRTLILQSLTDSSAKPIEHLLNYKDFANSTRNLPVIYSLKEGVSAPSSTSLSDWKKSVELAYPSLNPGQYQQGKFSFMIFGLPAASVAMVIAAPKQNRKLAASIVVSAGLTSFLTGITEPIEFTFLFLAPWLFWGIHAILCAVSFWLASLLGANIGQTFSGGILDLIIYGIIPDVIGAKTNTWIVVVVGLVYVPIYFFLFLFLIKKFDIKTPGRSEEAVKLYTKADYLAKNKSESSSQSSSQSGFKPVEIKAYKVYKAYGGRKNIQSVDACITKLRISVKDPQIVDEATIKSLGSPGIVRPSKNSVYAIFGVEADTLKVQIKRIIDGELNEDELAKLAK